MEFKLKSVERFDRGRTDKQPKKKTPQRALEKLHKRFFRPDQVVIETLDPLMPLEVCSLLLRQGRQGTFTVGLIFRDGTTQVLT